MLELTPITFAEAKAFVESNHRHHGSPVSHKYSIAASENGKVVGVVIVGRPVARHYDNGWTLEVARFCTDGTKNACSFLYGAAWRAAKALGYRRLVTYTLLSEDGASLMASGWKVLHQSPGGSWSTKGRPRVDKHPLEPKLCWEAV